MHICQDEVAAVLAALPFLDNLILRIRVWFTQRRKP